MVHLRRIHGAEARLFLRSHTERLETEQPSSVFRAFSIRAQSVLYIIDFSTLLPVEVAASEVCYFL